MKNLGAILAAAGSDWAKVVKTTILLVDMADFAAVNVIYGRVRLFCYIVFSHISSCWSTWLTSRRSTPFAAGWAETRGEVGAAWR